MPLRLLTSPRSISSMNRRRSAAASEYVPLTVRSIGLYDPSSRSRPTLTRICHLRHFERGTDLSSWMIEPLPLTFVPVMV